MLLVSATTFLGPSCQGLPCAACPCRCHPSLPSLALRLGELLAFQLWMNAFRSTQLMLLRRMSSMWAVMTFASHSCSMRVRGWCKLPPSAWLM